MEEELKLSDFHRLLDFQNFTLSDFCNLPVLRWDTIATLVVAYYQGDEKQPITLFGFIVDGELSDFEVQEHGYNYLTELLEELKRE